MTNLPTLPHIADTRRLIDPYIMQTPVWQWQTREIAGIVGNETSVFLKLELWQHTGTFKPRGALSAMLALDQAQLKRGVTAVSAGNHAIAVAYAARQLNSNAKVVMVATANPARVALCRAFGAEVELIEDVHEAFDRVRQIEAEESKAFIHPFEGEKTVLGSATLGVEFAEQVANLDAVIVPIGGGGLCAGVAAGIKLMQPNCQIFGVEPEGADSMHRSFASGKPKAIEAVQTIADSLGAPFALPYSFEVCRHFVDELALVNDDELIAGMRLMMSGAKLAVEPAGAAAVAALCGTLRERLWGKRVGLIVCGANIDPISYAKLVGENSGG